MTCLLPYLNPFIKVDTNQFLSRDISPHLILYNIILSSIAWKEMNIYI